MKVFASRRWRKWATVSLGASMFIAPWILGTVARRSKNTQSLGITFRARISGGETTVELTRG